MAEEGSKKSRFSHILSFFLGALTVGIIVGGYMYINSLADAPASNLANPPGSVGVEKIVKDVGKLVKLPEDETPQLATVSDTSKLFGQPFFVDAQNGDMVLIFQKSQKAVLYRPTIEKVINYSLVTLPSPQPSPQVTGSVSGSPTPTGKISPTPAKKFTKIVILNGSKESGLAKKAEGLVKSESNEIELGNAKGDYQTSIISSVGNNKMPDSELQKIVKSIIKIKIPPKVYPKTESVPADADIVIILGEDFSKAY